MKINLYITCIDYADFLSETLKFNHKLFEKIYVATSPQDVETHKLGEKYQNLHIEKTDSFFYNGAKFNKGKGLNTILKYIEPDTWSIIGDADCIYNENLINEILLISKNDSIKHNLFGCCRVNVENKNKLDNALKELEINPYTKEKINTPICNSKVSILMGFCQIFNSSSKFLNGPPKYPENFITAAESDLRFRNLWPPNNRCALNSLIIHLGYPKMNWNGRITPRWGEDTFPP